MTDTTTRQHDALSDPPAPPSSRGSQQQHEVSIKSAATTTVTVTASAAANNNNKIIIDINNNNAPPQCCSDIVNHGSRGTSLGSNHSSQHYDSVSSSSSASSSSSSGGSQLDDDDAFTSDYDGLYEVRRRLGSGNHSDVFLAYWKGGGLLHDRGDADKEEEVIASLADTPPPAAEATSTSGINMNAPSGGIEIAVKVTNVLSPHIHRELRCLQHVQRHLRDQARRLEESLGSQQQQHECALTLSLPCPQLFFHTLARKEKCGGASTANKNTIGSKRRGGTKRVRSPSGSDAAACSPSPLPLADSAARHILGVELLGPDVFEFTDRFRLTEAEVCWVAMQMLRSLTAVHAASVVHRSVKPENFCFAKAPTTTLTPQGGEEGEYPIKLIDYGRGTVADEGGSRLEEPYTGWWHSLRGFLGQPLGPKDDLLGIVHTVGFILDDYLLDDQDKDGDDHVDGDCVGASERAADADDAVGVSCLDDRPLQRWQRVGDYSCCRRVLSDAIQDALDACRDEERREAKKRPRHEGGGDHHHHPQAQVATTRTSSAAEARQLKRQRRVAHIELEVLPGLLPDRYYPDRLPHWWKAWYAVCAQHWSDDQVSAEAMSACMRNTLVERISQGCDNTDAAVDAVGIDVLSLVHRRAP